MLTHYKTILKPAEGNFSDSGSKFLSYIFHCTDENFIRSKKQELKKQHHKAVHVVHALRLGEDGSHERSSDDGEPSGSAGKPVLNELKSRELTNIAVFVVRYFGGKKLGIPGLIHAYRCAAADGLDKAEMHLHTIREFYKIMCRETEMPAILHVLYQNGAHVESDELSKFVFSCKRSEKAILLSRLSLNRNIEIEFLYSA